MQQFGEKALYAIIGEYLTPKEIIKNSLDIILKNKQVYSTEDWIFATYFGRYDLIEWLYKNINKYDNNIHVYYKFGEYTYLFSNFTRFPFEKNEIFNLLIEVAAMRRNIKLLKQLYNKVNKINKVNKDNYAITIAAEYGNFKIIKWLYKKGYKIKESSIYRAIENGHLKMTKFLVENFKEDFNIQCAIESAAYNRHINIVMYFFKKYKSQIDKCRVLDEACMQVNNEKMILFICSIDFKALKRFIYLLILSITLYWKKCFKSLFGKSSHIYWW
jgi:hypothetical protein